MGTSGGDPRRFHTSPPSLKRKKERPPGRPQPPGETPGGRDRPGETITARSQQDKLFLQRVSDQPRANSTHAFECDW